MTPEQWTRLDDLFEEATELSPPKWDGFVGTRCAGDDELRDELLSLLRAHSQATDVFDEPLAVVGALVDGESAEVHDAMIGVRLGGYTIESVLGRGGMGVVYRARQDSPERVVALKVVNPGTLGATSLRRFTREAEVLGRLQHPGVAQIYESGRARTPLGLQPYFAMELVEGRPLLDYARERGLDTRERLELHAKVCDAVQYAHVKGVIHRDLKPGNILVDGRGQPKILDFGIARVTDSDIRVTTMHTDVGQLIGTVAYMSPEQAAGDPRELDTRSDVYALGVVLFELLSGRLPYDLKERPITEAVRIVSQGEPTRLGSISRVFRGDIETIVGKALEKDRNRRYQAAADLAADLRRFLLDEAIVARPASTVYQLRKFARRNKALVGGVACAFVLLVAGVIGTSVGLARAMSAESQAREDARKARVEARNATQATNFVQNMLKSANPESGSPGDVTVRELLAEASLDLDADLANEPEVCAAVHYSIGSAYAGMQDDPLAIKHLERALELRRGVYGDRGWRVANCIHKLALIACKGGGMEAGLRDLRRGLNMINEDPDALWEDITVHHSDFAQMLNQAGRYEEAEREARAGIELVTRLGGPRHLLAGVATATLVGVYVNQGKYPEAEPLCRTTLDIAREKYGPRSPRVASRLIELGKILSNLSRGADAEVPLAEALDIRRSVFGPRHVKVAVALERLANAQMSNKKLTAAESSARESLSIRREAAGADDEETLSAMVMLSRILSRQNKLDEAEPLIRETLNVRLRTVGEDHRLTAQTMETLGDILTKQKKYEDAKVVLTRAVDVRRRVLSPRHVLVSNGLRDLGRLSVEVGDRESAVKYFQEAASILDEAFEDDHAVLIGVRRSLGTQLAALGRHGDAADAYRAVLAGLSKKSGEIGQDVAECLVSLAGVLKAGGDEAGAADSLARAERARTAVPSSGAR